MAQSRSSQKSIRDQPSPLDNQDVPELPVDSGSVRPVLVPRMVIGRDVRLQRTKLKHHRVNGSSKSFGGWRQHCIDIRRENIGEDDEAAIDSANLTACGLQVRTQAPGLITGCQESARRRRWVIAVQEESKASGDRQAREHGPDGFVIKAQKHDEHGECNRGRCLPPSLPAG